MIAEYPEGVRRDFNVEGHLIDHVGCEVDLSLTFTVDPDGAIDAARHSIAAHAHHTFDDLRGSTGCGGEVAR